jgi:hypothetical protein
MLKLKNKFLNVTPVTPSGIKLIKVRIFNMVFFIKMKKWLNTVLTILAHEIILKPWISKTLSTQDDTAELFFLFLLFNKTFTRTIFFPKILNFCTKQMVEPFSKNRQLTGNGNQIKTDSSV